MPKNTVNLSNLPRKGTLIDWKNAHHTPISFHYRGVDDVFYVEKDVDADHVLASYQNKEYELPKISIVRAAFGKLFGFASANNYKYEVGDIIKHRTKASIKILKQIRSASVNHRAGIKAYEAECLECHSVFEVREGNLGKGDRCPYCSNHKVREGLNDIAHTKPELVKYFVHPEDATKYVLKSNAYVEVKCPDCNTVVGMRSIYDLQNYGVNCPSCGSGTSYPNRFMYNLLECLNVEFDNETRFDWCVFPSYKDKTKKCYGLFDFVLLQSKIIVEMDSGLGHGRYVFSNSDISSEETLYRDQQKDLLAQQHGYRVIRVDCQYYNHQNRFEAVKSGILNSDLTTVLNLSNIDFNKINVISM